MTVHLANTCRELAAASSRAAAIPRRLGCVSSQESARRIVWIDCEMTGLNLDQDVLVEVAALVTDQDLRVLGDGVDVVIKPSDSAVAGMDDFVRNMHTESGLIDAWADGVTVAEAERAVMDYITTWVPEAGKAPLAGNSIATDRGFLARHMPKLDGHLHYRMVDVSSIKELAKRWYPRVYFAAPDKTGNHRALGDIVDSINELRYYRSALFVPMPGPTTDQARAVATAHAGADLGVLSQDPPLLDRSSGVRPGVDAGPQSETGGCAGAVDGSQSAGGQRCCGTDGGCACGGCGNA